MDTPNTFQRFPWGTALLALFVAIECSCSGARNTAPTPAPKESIVAPSHQHKAAVRTAVPMAAIRSAPVPQAAASQSIEDELNRLPVGQIAFNPPSSMKVATTERVQVRVSETKGAADAAKMSGNVQTAPIQVSPVMSVQLQGASFQITPLDPQDQIVTPDGYTQWDFDVTPTANGDQTLSLTASVEIAVPGMGTQRRAFPVLTRTVHVQVNPVSFLTDNWQWFAGTIIIPLALLGWQRLGKSRSAAKAAKA